MIFVHLHWPFTCTNCARLLCSLCDCVNIVVFIPGRLSSVGSRHFCSSNIVALLQYRCTVVLSLHHVHTCAPKPACEMPPLSLCNEVAGIALLLQLHLYLPATWSSANAAVITTGLRWVTSHGPWCQAAWY